MNSRPEAWLHQAQLARENGFLAQACYFASQAAEKALKGALLEIGIEPPHTHVLNDLVYQLEAAGLNTGALQALPDGHHTPIGLVRSGRCRSSTEHCQSGSEHS